MKGQLCVFLHLFAERSFHPCFALQRYTQHYLLKRLFKPQTLGAGLRGVEIKPNLVCLVWMPLWRSTTVLTPPGLAFPYTHFIHERALHHYLSEPNWL